MRESGERRQMRGQGRGTSEVSGKVFYPESQPIRQMQRQELSHASTSLMQGRQGKVGKADQTRGGERDGWCSSAQQLQ